MTQTCVFYTVLQIEIVVVQRVRKDSFDNNDVYRGGDGKTPFLGSTQYLDDVILAKTISYLKLLQ